MNRQRDFRGSGVRLSNRADGKEFYCFAPCAKSNTTKASRQGIDNLQQSEAISYFYCRDGPIRIIKSRHDSKFAPE
jgi:hypothetical protein